ncbi:MAG: sugar ABC transporter ATP-binding protein, partial [Eubacteriales bacterium]|nr:sugar ABC transporter ATP-binding protein [Eubacteriales bacterium]
MENSEYRLEMKEISKQFGGIKALDQVSIRLRQGEIHALIGENGAGKSTLIKILSGAYTKDGGSICIDGREVAITSPLDAKRLGVAVIYQEFMLAPDLTVAENVFIDRLAEKGRLINWKRLNQETAERLSELGFGSISPRARLGTLSVAHQQIVEICKCLTRNAKILILDEPTAVLTVTEIQKLFALIRKLKSEGVSILFVSHHMNEIFQLCDFYTVLKDGKYAGSGYVGEVTDQELIHMMIGRELIQMYPRREANMGAVVLQVENLSVENKVDHVSFQVRSGEILGFAGLVGSGRTETMLAVFGAEKKSSGRVVLSGKEADFRQPADAVRAGLGYLSENRKSLGLLVDQSIRINVTLSSLRKVTKHGFLRHAYEKSYVGGLLSKMSTKYGSTEHPVSSLSGGNQQKICFAKWMSADCRCVVFDEPTRGVDVGAKVEIYELMNHLAEQGVAVIMISSEMTEIIGMCDRAIIMHQGRITGEVGKEDLSEDRIIQYAMG